MTLSISKVLGLTSLLLLPACLEPQPAPDLTERPMTDFNVEVVAEGLDTPWSLTPIPSGGYLVTEKAGTLKHIGAQSSVSNISGLPGDIYTKQQAGLFDVVLSSDFTDTGQLYLSYAYGTDAANGTALIRAVLEDNLLTDIETLFKAAPKDTAAHFGGRIVLMPDSSIVLTLGDGFVYREAAQDKTSHLGKIIRLNQDGSAFSGNPFFGQENVKTEIYSYGHRNVQGAALDPETGQIWTHEHGPRGGDELNLMTSGGNYGWPLATTGTDYNGAKITPHNTLSETQAFVHDWVPSIAPSGLVIYRGDVFPDWNGDAIIGGLASRDLRRVDLENGTSTGEEILLSDINARIRDVRVDTDGALLIVTNTKKDGEAGGGQVLRVLPK